MLLSLFSIHEHVQSKMGEEISDSLLNACGVICLKIRPLSPKLIPSAKFFRTHFILNNCRKLWKPATACN
ncbi:hypothetical protein QN277_016110 [Acacia crassicarpa]|uniref:Uncharacterized protein n=1 Tax=Acacia crassicarpa TaxID=499986 RepID=A0AAE1TBS6_9FABA|nr:hypothetical protein QN277_016110 [Acacia crassicarpa]